MNKSKYSAKQSEHRRKNNLKSIKNNNIKSKEEQIILDPEQYKTKKIEK